jgi:hypothetical protein
MTIDAAKGYLREQWPNIRSQLLGGTYPDFADSIDYDKLTL